MSSLLNGKLASDADPQASPEPSKPICTDRFQITGAEPWAIETGSWYLFSSQPKLCFQMNQGPCGSEGEDSMFPLYNIWSPSYFGISLPKPNPTQDTQTIRDLGDVSPSDRSSMSLKRVYKLSCNDLVVTSYEDDTASLKAGDTGPIPFNRENVVGGIDIDHPSFLQCRCCLRYRGWVTLANGERWRFDEIDALRRNGSCYQFQRVHERTSDWEFPKTYSKMLQWECFSDWKSNYGEAPADMPFNLDQNTRLCRVSSTWYKRHGDVSELVAPVIAILNRDGLVFIDGLKEGNDIKTGNLRELVLMTGLTIAKFERPALQE